mmetsp:Transcript_5873/g.11470  ORF Transcript_5873/g.11470 Transcript_5873/m.11470 type:complete len:285 (+) Transcript_5873:77-931(+)
MPYPGPVNATVPAWREKLKSGKTVALGCAINTSSPLAAELVASLDYDFVLIDQQHSAIDPEKLRNLLQAVHCARCHALVRVGGADDRIGIQQALDLGADGILVPCSKTADDIRKAVSCAKYPVRGPGSVGGTRSVFLNLRPQLPGGFAGLIDYVVNTGNERAFVAAQIETNEALENIEEICKVEGLDCAFIGPGDLATDMGLVKEFGMPACWGSDKFKEAEKKIAETCLKNGVIPGYWSGSVEEKGKLGFRFFVTNSDILAMSTSLEANLKELREAQKGLGLDN